MITTHHTNKEYLNLAEASEVSGRSIATLRRAIKAKRLSACKPSGKFGKTFIRPVDLTAYMEGNRIKALNEGCRA